VLLPRLSSYGSGRGRNWARGGMRMRALTVAPNGSDAANELLQRARGFTEEQRGEQCLSEGKCYTWERRGAMVCA
jgi:hypothetical protein